MIPADPALSRQPRAMGEVRLSVRSDEGVMRLAGLRQAGSLRALFPRHEVPALEAVLLNTAGGLTGGDRLSVEATAAESARLTLTTQACERIYRASGTETARVETRLCVEADGRIDWLPQETILYEGSRLERRLIVDLAPGATALLVEAVLFGRLAKGETLRDVRFRDRWEVRRDGALVFAEAQRLAGDVDAVLDRPGVAAGARAMATVVLAGDGAGALLGRVRALLPAGCGASLVREGVLVVRLLAVDGFALRAGLIPLILLLSGTALPKVWRL